MFYFLTEVRGGGLATCYLLLAKANFVKRKVIFLLLFMPNMTK